jgi:HD-GYP domain-containing protein (c-di-GMP phosphodiesterase class II)
MKTKSDFFFIEIEHLREKILFSFHIYIFNSLNNKFNTFLYANSPLNEEKKSFLVFILDRGGKIAILKKQQKTFLKTMQFLKDEVQSLKVNPPHKLEIEQEKNLAEMENQKTFDFPTKMRMCTSNNDFSEIINRVKKEVLCFSPKISHTVSLAKFFCQTLLNEDNSINRIISFSYFLAKLLNLEDEQTLSELVVAGYLHDIGITQINKSIIIKPTLNLNDHEKSLFKKHMGLSQHLIRKSSLEISKRVLTIILDHHERFDGSGYPSNKLGQSIDPLSLILGLTSHIFEFSSGKITGKDIPIDLVIKKIQDKNFTPGLEFEFGDTINQLIKSSY